jgi:hypothetical protein
MKSCTIAIFGRIRLLLARLLMSATTSFENDRRPSSQMEDEYTHREDRTSSKSRDSVFKSSLPAWLIGGVGLKEYV